MIAAGNSRVVTSRFSEEVLMKRLSRSLLALIAVCMASIAAFATDFTPAQKDEIGTIVREYLLKNPELIREVLQELERKETAAEDANGSKVRSRTMRRRCSGLPSTSSPAIQRARSRWSSSSTTIVDTASAPFRT